jgi:hypothetical protein
MKCDKVICSNKKRVVPDVSKRKLSPTEVCKIVKNAFGKCSFYSQVTYTILGCELLRHATN